MGHLKLKDGTSFPLNLSVGEIRDISKRKGTFSKTVTLVGDDDNNNLLNHYYDVNVIAGTFDVNKLQQCQIIQNGIVILDNAYMQLVEVVKKQTTDAHNQQIEYKVLVKDSVSDFFTKLGNDTLTDINVHEILLGGSSPQYTSANVNASFSYDITRGYKFVLPYDTDNEYNLKAFHPAIFAKIYFDAIFQRAGFTYEWGNQSPNVHTTNNNYFEKLVIPYNGGVPTIDRQPYLVEATYGSGTPFGTGGLTFNQQITGFTEVTDGESIFDPVNGDYSVPFYCQNPENIQIVVEIDYDVDLVAGGAGTRTGAGSLQIGLATKEQSSSTYYTENLETFTAPASVSLGVNNIVSGATKTITLNPTNLFDTDVLEMFVRSVNIGTFSYTVGVDTEVTINSSTWSIIPSADTVGYQQDIDLNLYVPRQIKQADFIKSIFMMYNLYAEVDKSQPNKIILKSRDDYYDAGNEVDWTAKLAKDRDQTLQFLPELTTKKMVLSYKDDKDDINEVYKEATNETYGQIEYTFENEYVKGVDRKELIFSPTPILRTNYGAYVPALSYIPETNIRILVDGDVQTGLSFEIYDYYNGSTGVGTTATTAPLITHFDDPETPSFDLNFATCDYYFYSELSQKTNNNLYNLYWRRTLGQIDKGKMLTAWFDLNEVDIQSLKLNDKIRIDNSWWHINRVIDYDANEHKLTKVELISVDEELEFTPFATTPSVPVKPNNPIRPVRPVRPTRPETNRPVKDIIKKNNESKNLVKGDVEVKGLNNVIQSDVQKAIVVGDNLNVEEDGIHTEKLFINGMETTGNLANIDLEQTDKVRTYKIPDASGGTINFTNANDDSIIYFTQDEVVVNNNAQDHDVRVEGQTDADLFFTDASTDRVGIGTNTPSQKFHVYKLTGSLGIMVESGDTSQPELNIKNTAGNYRLFLNSSGVLYLQDKTTSNRHFLANSSLFNFNPDQDNIDFKVEGQTDSNLFFVDASADNVYIGQNTGSYKLDVNGDVNVASGSAYRHNGTAGLSGTYTFGGGSSGDIASMTFNGGILTAVTTVP